MLYHKNVALEKTFLNLSIAEYQLFAIFVQFFKCCIHFQLKYWYYNHVQIYMLNILTLNSNDISISFKHLSLWYLTQNVQSLFSNRNFRHFYAHVLIGFLFLFLLYLFSCSSKTRGNKKNCYLINARHDYKLKQQLHNNKSILNTHCLFHE